MSRTTASNTDLVSKQQCTYALSSETGSVPSFLQLGTARFSELKGFYPLAVKDRN